MKLPSRFGDSSLLWRPVLMNEPEGRCASSSSQFGSNAGLSQSPITSDQLPVASDKPRVQDPGARPQATEPPFLQVNWERVVFLHFAVDPKILRCHVPWALELELYQGQACVTLVALTMRSFRTCGPRSPGAWLFRPIATQRFLNVRTYARYRGEPGAFFLWGWLSQPFRVPLPSGLFKLPYGFASLEYRHGYETGEVAGRATVAGTSDCFNYHARVEPHTPFRASASDGLAEFALERYRAWFQRGDQLCSFRAWHPPWLQTAIDVRIEDDTLVTARFPWFKEARLILAHYAPGFGGVQLGKPHRVCAPGGHRASRSVLGAFYEMP